MTSLSFRSDLQSGVLDKYAYIWLWSSKSETFVNQLDIREDWNKSQTNISRPSLLNCIPIQSTRSGCTIVHEYWRRRVAWVMEAASIMEQVLVKSWHERPNFFPPTTIIALGRFTPSLRRVVYRNNNLTSISLFHLCFLTTLWAGTLSPPFYASIHMNIAPHGISLPIVWGWKSLQKPLASVHALALRQNINID